MKISEVLPRSSEWHPFDNAETLALGLAEAVANCLRETIRNEGRALLALSGGNTPKRFLQCLSTQTLDWSHVDAILVDERWVDSDHARSNEAMIRRCMMQNAASELNFYGFKTAEPHPESAIPAIEQTLEHLGWPIDVLVLGMGDDGHTASLFPGMANLEQALAGHDQWLWVARPDTQAEARITLSGDQLSRARHCFLHIEGASKQQTLAQACAEQSVLKMPIWFILERRHMAIYWAPTDAERDVSPDADEPTQGDAS